MNKPHKHAEVIKAWADGANIQAFNGVDWTTIEEPAWLLGIKYRVKPKENVERYKYAYRMKSGYTGISSNSYKHEEEFTHINPHVINCVRLDWTMIETVN